LPLKYTSLRSLLITISSLAIILNLYSQKKNENYHYKINEITSPIVIDGKLDEEAWKSMNVAENFNQVLPMDTSKAILATKVRMGYDDKNIYISYINYNKNSEGKYIIESLKRDFNFTKNDNNVLFIDTYDDQTNGYTFGSNVFGAPWDGLIVEGASADLSWENKWTSEVSHDNEKWIWEASIPFKSLKYKKGNLAWGINFSRLDLTTTEKSAWAPVGRQFPTSSLAFTGNLLWDKAPPAVKNQFTLIPYVTSSYVKINIPKTIPGKITYNAGLDAKFNLTSSINLDLTVNPDFSQVEVDRQQINLDRFELFFPERRQFFIENGDLFTNFGTENIRPFFSRRIGSQSSIINGLKVSGKLNKDWRLGIINALTSENKDITPLQNFTAVAIQRRVFSRSNVAFMVVNKQSFGLNKLPEARQSNFQNYNTNFASEYNLASKNNEWKGKFMYLQSISEKNKSDNVITSNISFSNKKYFTNLRYERVGELIDAEVGFIPRKNYSLLAFRASNNFFPKNSKSLLLSHGFSCGGNSYSNLDFTKNNEYEFFISYKLNFRNTSNFTMWTSKDYQKLQNKIDPTNFVGSFLNSGTEHNWRAWGIEYSSKPQSAFTYSFASRYGGYYADGTRLRLNSELGFRFQPYATIGVNVNYNALKFKDNEILPSALKNNDYQFWLVSPRIDITLTNKLYITGIAQYNNQINNTNLNFRVQWRYSPASDIFLVYTDNYFTDMFQLKNRSLVFKMNYWL
jgi:hypothetical protein